MKHGGNLFFLSVIEQGKLPRGLIWAGHWLAGGGALLGIAAALDMVFPPVPTDRLLNLVIAGTAITVALSGWIAGRRGSRVVWFYLIGWGPVICVFLARLWRNLGMAPQNDLIDVATFAAIAFEALVLSLAIADRFRLVSQKLELAKQRRAVDAAEARALRIAALTDFMTGLGNRAAFQETASELIEIGKPFSLFLIDVDHLKAVNDRFGHAGGDALLREVATALSPIAQAHPGTHVSRIGGDEFAILIPGGLLPEAAMEEALTQLQGKIWRCMDQDRSISLSIGSARFPEDAAQIEVLHLNADLALYNAKRLGRTRYFRYDPLQRILRDLQIDFANDADAALGRDEFRLHVQPIVSLPTRAVCGYEALLRWNHPDHGLMVPERFAEVLEANWIGLRIQEHVLELALVWLAEQREPIGTLGVNFTAAQLVGPQAAQHVLDRLAHHGVRPASLSIEVTEAVLLGRSGDAVLATLQTLRKSGICIALDSFGTGFTSLPHLREMPVDKIKIDSSFIAGLDQDGGRTLEVVRAIAGLAQGLGKVLVAEGVETEAQAQWLTELGCQLAQGFLFGRPVPVPTTLQSRNVSAMMTFG
jgi:diguanylate cyclase (GGDEF)-like protein